MRFVALYVALIVNLLAACGEAERNSDARERPVFSGHKFDALAARSLDVGEDCSKVGPNSCLTRICIHFESDPQKGYACSTACESDLDCPSAWICSSLLPGPGNAFCIPPERWSYTKTAKRVAPAGTRRPPPLQNPNGSVAGTFQQDGGLP
jgi:hypothetical protein